MDIRDICIIYCTKELYIIPNKYSKLLYAVVISPLVIGNGFYNTGIITTKYWKFLRNMCYPHSGEKLTYDSDCSIYHNEECSNTLLKNDYLYTLHKITSMYFKYYLIHGTYLLIFKKTPITKVLIKEFENWVRSSAFLFLQNVFQRFSMCKIPNISIIHLYLITFLSSNCIFFESINRVKQINTMMLSNMIISTSDNYYKPYKNKLTFILLMLTFSKNKYIKIPTLLLSIVNGIQEYKDNKDIIPKCLTDETPIMSMSWHPFL
jgi:hypothetical protein